MATLIKGGTVYDGTGDPPREADVLVHGGTIARLAVRLNRDAKEIIDARGALITPGFVDIANYADHYDTLFSDPAGTEPLLRGITSIVVGQGGASPAPLFAHGAVAETWWGNSMAAAAHATTMGEFFSLLKKRMGVNVGTLVGYATVREGIVRGVPRDLTDREFELLEQTLHAALADGALGVSINLEYIRTAHAPHHELLMAARVAAEADALVALRLRDRESELKKSFAEVLAISESAGANILVTDLEPYVNAHDAYRALLTQITRASAEHHIHFSTSGSGSAAIPLPLLLPPHFRESEWFLMTEHLKDSALRTELRAHLARYRDTAFHIGMIADRSLKLFEGTPFSKWSLHEHLPFEDALMSFMAITGFRAILTAQVGHRSTDRGDGEANDLARTFAVHDRACIASGEVAVPSLEMSSPLAFLGDAWNRLLPREQRVAKMTGQPAKKLGLTRRGLVREGYDADILVLDPASTNRDEAGKHRVREALVNGIRAIAGGTPTGHRGGEVLIRA